MEGEKWEKYEGKWENVRGNVRNGKGNGRNGRGNWENVRGVGKYQRENVFGSVVLCQEMAIRGDH